ncbi:hypothetical protein [Psychrobacillus phage Spoks]|nr:hypothetical protein [Psychrobacillus phage Spoks]
MNKIIFKVDAENNLLYDTQLEVGIDEEVEGYINTPLPTDSKGHQLPFWKPQWNGTEWIEARPQEEIEAELNAPKEPTPLEIISQDVEAVAEMVAIVTEDSAMVAETVAIVVEDSLSVAETLALALMEIENLKSEIAILKGV